MHSLDNQNCDYLCRGWSRIHTGRLLGVWNRSHPRQKNASHFTGTICLSRSKGCKLWSFRLLGWLYCSLIQTVRLWICRFWRLLHPLLNFSGCKCTYCTRAWFAPAMYVKKRRGNIFLDQYLLKVRLSLIRVYSRLKKIKNYVKFKGKIWLFEKLHTMMNIWWRNWKFFVKKVPFKSAKHLAFFFKAGINTARSIHLLYSISNSL